MATNYSDGGKNIELTPSERRAEHQRVRRHRSKNGSGSGHQSRSRRSSSPSDYWLWGFDACLLLTLCVPFFLGGRIAPGELLLVAATIGCSVCWIGHQFSKEAPTCIWTRVELLLVAVIALGLLQVTPLPTWLLDVLSPEIKNVLPMWTNSPESPVGPWRYLSLNVGETRPAIALGVTYVLIFWMTAQRIRSFSDATRILKAVCVVAALMAGFGLLQYFGSNGKYFWFFEYPTVTTADQVKGAFTNKNHFAAFLMLALGPCIWWLMETTDSNDASDAVFGVNRGTPLPRTARIALVAIATALVIVGWMSSLSRGAVVAGACGVGGMLLLMALRSLISMRLVGSLCLLGIVAGALQFSVGFEAASNRLDRWDDNGRMQIWKANLAAEADFPLFGSGIGGHRHIYHRYLDKAYDDHEFSHAESNYLNVTTEAGLVGLSLALMCLALSLSWCIQGLRASTSKSMSIACLALMASLIANIVHSLVDFTWYVPGYMAVLILQLACARRLSQFAVDPAKGHEKSVGVLTMPRFVLVPTLLVLVVTSAWMVKTELPNFRAEPHWLAYRRLVFAADPQSESVNSEDESPSSEEADPRSESVATRKIKALRAAVRENPHDPRFHMRLSRHYVLMFEDLQRLSENPMPLNQIRDAALNVGFETQSELDEWLNRAVGGNVQFIRAACRHTKRAMQLSPLMQQPYLDFSEFGFLNRLDAETEQRCLKQALAVAPFDGYTLFLAGREAWMRDDHDGAFAFWKKAYHRNTAARDKILNIVVGSGVAIDPENVANSRQTELLIKLFDPNLKDLEEQAKIQKLAGYQLEEQRTLTTLAKQLREKASGATNSDRLNDWLKTAAIYGRLNQPDQVEDCFRQALLASPNSYVVHYEFGVWLYQQRRANDSLDHLRWCERLQPGDRKLARLIERIQHGSLPPTQIQQAHASQVSPQ